ncbi:MAG: ABC transporter ATP-binding protein [Opitutaceae bacterium]|jgi:nitrate ABC transporter ATP-binding subunit
MKTRFQETAVLDSVQQGSAPEAAPSSAGSLVLRGVSKTYRVDGKPLQVLQDIDLAVEPGEFVTMVGTSGCGKSTILRLVVGLDDAYDGEIFLDGRQITGPGLERSIVFQEHRLLPWLTVEQNIAIALDATGQTREARARLVHDHIGLVGLRGFEKAYPRQLSGGMAQRTAIARGLVTRPEILLLDEPLGALDSLTRSYLQQELLRIWRQEKVSVVMVTHDVEEAVFLSDKIVVLTPRPGRIKKVIPIDLPHPRNRVDPAFSQIRQEVLEYLSADYTI